MRRMKLSLTSDRIRPKGNWAKQWCPGYEEPGVFAGVASGFNSLGGVGDKYITGGAAAANFESKAFSAKMGVCFDIKAIKRKSRVICRSNLYLMRS